MRQKRLLWRIYFSFLATTVVALAVTGWYASRSLGSFHKREVGRDLFVRASILANDLSVFPSEIKPLEYDRFCKDLGRQTQTRITIISPDGKVIGDSEADPDSMENHANRPEIAMALMGKGGQATRFSDTKQRTLMYVAAPVVRDGKITMVARVALPLSVVDWALGAVYRNIAIGVGLVAVFFALVAFHVSRRITKPVEEMRAVADRLAAGELGARVGPQEGAEMDALARTLNQMATQLGERFDTIKRQRNEQKAVFKSMVEGVLAVDSDERVLDFNDAAQGLLDLDDRNTRGKSIQEAVRNTELQEFIGRALSSSEPVEGDISLHGNKERYLQLHGAALADASGGRLGAVIVLNDVTRLKRLETVRRDFVANVSHELKTPITALKGCVETLEGSPAVRHPETEKFIKMMGRHADRLNAIVEDLLMLSRIEFDAERNTIELVPGPVGDVVQRAANLISRSAEAKRIVVTVKAQADVAAAINAALLEQAVSNLLDNAVKYSEEGTRIEVMCSRKEGFAEISVRDQGPGIEKKHLPRIFERFYRVDSARSRALGGTGLGLAIVKHIAIAHRGSVEVESTPGQGSVFTIRIPAA